MSLCIINEVTTLNITFYVAFAFIFDETFAIYEWIFEQFLKFYLHLNFSNFIFFDTDCEMSLINEIITVFSDANYALYLWHVNKNVLKNCKNSFDDQESWTTFFNDWHSVMYAAIEMKYEIA